MKISLIAAVSKNNVIGKNGKVPWKIGEDLQRFRRLTFNHSIIMGRKTFESIGKPLSQRKNIVLTNKKFYWEGVKSAQSIEEAIRLCENQDAYVIGGKIVYEQFLKIATEIELTRVHQTIENGNAFFPEIDWNLWNEKFVEKHEGFSFHTYERKSY